jgi:chromate transporter
MGDTAESNATDPCTLASLGRYFLVLGTFGFGGPIALAGYMQKDLVESRRWYSKQEYLDGLALAQLAPGPLAAQLAMYLGWARFGVLGASVVSATFILPSFVMVVGLALGYLRFGGLTWMQGAFYGIGAAVIAIIARSAYKLTRLSLGKDKLLWAIFALNAFVTAWSESELALIILGSGVLVIVARLRVQPTAAALLLLPPWAVTGLHEPASSEKLLKLFWYFCEAGAFVFGSGLAIVPFLHGGVVNTMQWLTEQQFLDAVAVAMITPGPVVITVAFIGYLAAGPLGAVASALGVFLPCFLFVILPAPYYKRFGANTHVRAFVEGVTAAATGAIAGAAIVLGKRAIFDVPTVLIALVTLLILVRVKKAPEPVVIVVAGVVGLALHGLS